MADEPGADGSGNESLDTDVLFRVLADRDRRNVLFHLRQHGAATVEELVDVLVAVGDAGDVDGDGGDAAGRREYQAAALRHTYLPKLQAHGLVTHDPETGVVECAALPASVAEWLDLGVRQELRDRAEPSAEPTGEVRVLLIDDEPGLAEAVARYVEREHGDLSVRTATSAEEAVTTLRESAFDCIVSDYQMPAISGLDFLQAVREEAPELPFIIFTGKGSESTASEAISRGVTDYVPKTTDIEGYEELVDRIRLAVEAT
jgi:CheY-like chemotaxis protein